MTQAMKNLLGALIIIAMVGIGAVSSSNCEFASCCRLMWWFSTGMPQENEVKWAVVNM